MARGMTSSARPRAGVRQAAAYFQTRYTPHPRRAAVWRHVTRYLERSWKLPVPARVLELGCGYGDWIRTVNAEERHALDRMPEIEAWLAGTGIMTHLGECTDLSRWSDGFFDLVLASNLLEHLTLDDAELCVREVCRVLRPSGKLCIIQPNFALCPRRYFDDFTHVTVFTDVSLVDFLTACGMRVTRSWRRFLPFTMKRGGALASMVPLYLRMPVKPWAAQMCILAEV